MKHIVTLAISFLMVLSSPKGSGQNLVPNGDFETYNTCPSTLSGIGFSPSCSLFPTVASWVNPLKNSTPDYLNSCAMSSTGVKVPATVFGYQLAYNGNAYAGIIAWDGQNLGGPSAFDYREYIQNRLLQPLQAGRQYCVSFYVNPTISSGFSFNYVGINELGLSFSNAAVVNTTDYTLSLPVHISNPANTYLTDTSKWYNVKGVYTATGGESWFTVGCFKNGTSQPGFVQIFPAVADPNLSYRCYLYLDGFTIHEITAADTVAYTHDTVVCKPTGLNLSFAGVPGANNYEWNTGSNNPSLQASDTGIYWCRSGLDCGMEIDTFHVRYLQVPTLDLGNDTANCFSQPIGLSSNNVYSSYFWNTGAVTPAITATQTGDYILTVSSYCGVQKDTVHVQIQAPTSTPLVRDTTICQWVDGPLLNVTGSNIRWYSNVWSSYGIPVQPYLSTSQYGDFTWYVTQTIGQCESAKAPIHIKVVYKPMADIGDYYSICVNTDTVMLGHEYPDVTYLWNTAEVGCCILPRETGTYQLTISNECGSSTDTAFVEISTCDDCVFMPNAFSPNGDGRNDRFLPVLKCPVTDYKMSVFNRWGQEVFSTENTGQGWNGRFNDRPADATTYVFLMEFRSVTTGIMKHIRGNVTLLR